MYCLLLLLLVVVVIVNSLFSPPFLCFLFLPCDLRTGETEASIAYLQQVVLLFVYTHWVRSVATHCNIWLVLVREVDLLVLAVSLALFCLFRSLATLKF